MGVIQYWLQSWFTDASEADSMRPKYTPLDVEIQGEASFDGWCVFRQKAQTRQCSTTATMPWDEAVHATSSD